MNLTARRRALLVLLTFASLLGLPGMASAATTNEAGWTFFTTNGPCVWTNAAMNDEWGTPWAQTVAWFDFWAGGDNTTACADHTRNADTGRLAVREDLYFWNVNLNGLGVLQPGRLVREHGAIPWSGHGVRVGQSSVLLGHYDFLRGKGSYYYFGWQRREYGINTQVLYLP